MTKATTLVLMHLDRADYDELVLIEKKVKERLAQVTPTETPLLEEEKWYQHKKQLVKMIRRNELLNAVKTHKQFSGSGLKESKDYVEFLRDYVSHAENFVPYSSLASGENYAESRELLSRVPNNINKPYESTSPIGHAWDAQLASYRKI